jgi:hypothetical protein
MADMFWRSSRVPIRSYHPASWYAMKLDGAIESDSIHDPVPEGFIQRGLVLDRSNGFNWTIATALGELGEGTRSLDLRRQLQKCKTRLGPQRAIPHGTHRSKRLPSRHQSWEGVYDLARGATITDRGRFPSRNRERFRRRCDASFWHDLSPISGRCPGGCGGTAARPSSSPAE